MMVSVEDQLFRWYMKKNDAIVRQLARLDSFATLLIVQFCICANDSQTVMASTDVVGDFRIDSRHKIVHIHPSASPICMPKTDDLPALVLDIRTIPENTLITWSVKKNGRIH